MNTATVAMPVSRKSPGEGVPRSPAISVQEILRSDAKPEGVPSPALGNYPQQKIVDAMQRDIEFYGKREIKLNAGETAREKSQTMHGKGFQNPPGGTSPTCPPARRWT